jgi:uncharacterized protein YecE (DUF72 family)
MEGTPNPLRLRLGCPVWAFDGWRGTLYTPGARRTDFLPQYASVFGTVEGSATFYGLPSEATVRRWAAEAPPGFRFCFKFPRSVTHERGLVEAEADTARFLERMALLPDRLGPLLLQLGPGFGPRQLPALDRYLDGLPDARACVVEVRHPALFDDAAAERAFEELLLAHGAARGNFDTADVFAAPASDATTAEAQQRKPRLPWRAAVAAGPAFVRFVGRNAVADSLPALGRWVEPVRAWLLDGREVYFFTHTPDDAQAPELARAFHRLLRAALPALPELARFPGEAAAEREPRQAPLFG